MYLKPNSMLSACDSGASAIHAPASAQQMLPCNIDMTVMAQLIVVYYRCSSSSIADKPLDIFQ